MTVSGKVIGVFIVLALGLGVAYEIANRSQADPPSKATSSSGPPANAEYVGDSPQAILLAVGPAKKNGGNNAGAYVGKWVPEPGWTGTIEEITPAESGGVALRFLEHDPKIIGGSYWIIAVVGEDHGCTKGQAVRVQGRIKEVSMRTGPALTIINRIVLEDARVLR